MFHIYNSTVCLSFWWLPHIRLMNNAWWVVVFFRFKHIYIYTLKHTACRKCTRMFLIIFALFQTCTKAFGDTPSEKLDNHYKVKSTLHIFFQSWRQIWLLNILSKKIYWSTWIFFFFLIIFNMKKNCQTESKVGRTQPLTLCSNSLYWWY